MNKSTQHTDDEIEAAIRSFGGLSAFRLTGPTDCKSILLCMGDAQYSALIIEDDSLFSATVSYLERKGVEHVPLKGLRNEVRVDVQPSTPTGGSAQDDSQFVIEITGPAQGGFFPVRVLPSATVRLATTPTSIEASLVPSGLRMPNSKMRVLLSEPWRFTEVLGSVQQGVRTDGL